MQTMLSRLLDVRHRDEDVRRRGQNIILLATGLSVLTILLAGYVLLAVRSTLITPAIIAVISSLVVQSIVMALAHYGHVDLAGTVIVGMALIGVTGSAVTNADQWVVPLFFPVPLLMAAIVLRPLWIIVTFGGVLAGMAVVAGTVGSPENILLRNIQFFAIGLVSLFATFTSTLNSTGNQRLQQQLRAAAQQADQTAHALQTLNEELDLRVHMQTETLQQILQELEERTVYQEQLLKDLTEQRAIIRELSLPILPIGSDVLVVPLIGALDGERIQQLQTQALKHVERVRARMLILDVTGVPLIDTHVAQGLTALIQGLRLLGADVVIVGVRPEVAQTIVGLGIQLQGVRIFSDLGSALRSAALRFINRSDQV